MTEVIYRFPSEEEITKLLRDPTNMEMLGTGSLMESLITNLPKKLANQSKVPLGLQMAIQLMLSDLEAPPVLLITTVMSLEHIFSPYKQNRQI